MQKVMNQHLSSRNVAESSDILKSEKDRNRDFALVSLRFDVAQFTLNMLMIPDRKGSFFLCLGSGSHQFVCIMCFCEECLLWCID
ncbi:hypothetical protein T4B_9813 [Trichinella pseudospiralis]|uniref:Uncharacterized protein n=1 Tax=Trichinella pseudospiralis TaxID=6337 RepID=A0A0V1HJL8_TRIPS|nr:hypothetical protein T4B_9813 [Trichinella pseudospiralis]KRZ41748.1 hypothetical protein T4C_11163 [Trichinella pseudospiralis]